MQVGALFVSLGIRVDKSSLANAQRSISSVRSMLLSLGAAVAGGGLLRSMVGFNVEVESTRLNIQTMLSLAEKTSLADQANAAATAYEDLRKRASELPGSTIEYVQAFAKLVYPLRTAGVSLQKIQDLTVATVVAAKSGLGGATVKTAITDVLQGVEGRFSTVDFFLKALLEPLGYVGTRGRARFKALSKEQRAAVLQEALSQKAIVESAMAQSQSLAGVWDKARESLLQFLGRVGLPLFNALKDALRSLNAWAARNQATLQSLATTIGSVVAGAFEVVRSVIQWFAEHGDATRALLVGLLVLVGAVAARASAAWIAARGPMLAAWALVSVGVYIFEKLSGILGDIPALIAAAVATGGIAIMIRRVRELAAAWLAARAAAAAAPAATTASSAINGLSGLALGPAGRGAAVPRSSGGVGAAGAGFGALGGALGTAGAIGGAILATYAIGEVIDDMITTDEGRIRAQIAGQALRGGASWMDAINAGLDARLSEDRSAGATNVTIEGSTITINGVASGDIATIERVIQEHEVRQARHFAARIPGGAR
jgi:hypothetical protein